MTQRESKLSSKILLRLRQLQVFAFKAVAHEGQMTGLPDIIVCLDGRFVGFEVKLPEYRSRVSPRQSLVHERIEGSGGRVFVVSSVREVEVIVDELRIEWQRR